MESVKKPDRGWNISALHKTSKVVAMHTNPGRFTPVDLFLERGNVVFLGYLSFVVSHSLLPEQESWIHVSLHKHIAMLTPVRNGNAVGGVSTPPIEKIYVS